MLDPKPSLLNAVIDWPGNEATESTLRTLIPEPDEEFLSESPEIWPNPVNYIVCYVQRSGSTHLTSLLHGTGLAGKPADFFNVDYRHLPLENSQVFERTGVHSIVDAAAKYNIRSVSEYLQTIASVTRSPNGVFGLKMDLGQASIFLRRGLFWNPTWKWRYIFITRRDLLMQAISYHCALQTGSWSSLSVADKRAHFDEQAIVDCLMSLSDLMRRWECVFSLFGIEPLRITYEALDTDPNRVVEQCLQWLGVSFDPAQLNTSSVYDRQRTAQAIDWAEAIRTCVRENAAP